MAWAVRLSSVTLLHPRHRLELFGNIFAPPSSSGTRTVCIKISCKNSNGFWGSCRINTGGMKNWRFSTNISLYFENGTRYGPSYNERWIGIRMQSIEWCHFQWPLIVKKTLKWCIELLLQRQTNVKSYYDLSIRSAPFWLILNDP